MLKQNRKENEESTRAVVLVDIGAKLLEWIIEGKKSIIGKNF